MYLFSKEHFEYIQISEYILIFLGAQAPLGIARVKNNKNKNKRTKKFQSSIFRQIVRDDS